MPPAEVEALMPDLPGWMVVDDHHFERTFTFPDFEQAISFVNRVGFIAEEEGHHPVIRFSWGWATVQWWTHKINGIVLTDAILSARTSEIYEEMTS